MVRFIYHDYTYIVFQSFYKTRISLKGLYGGYDKLTVPKVNNAVPKDTYTPYAF